VTTPEVSRFARDVILANRHAVELSGSAEAVDDRVRTLGNSGHRVSSRRVHLGSLSGSAVPRRSTRRVGGLSPAGVATLVLVSVLVMGLGGCGNLTTVVHAAPLAHNTPLVYSGSLSGNQAFSGVAARSAQDGAPLWQANVGIANWAPVVVNGVVYALTTTPPVTGEIAVAVRVADGRVLWHTSVPYGDRSGFLTTDGTWVAVSTGSAGLYVLDAATGTLRWHLAGPVDQASPVRNGIVYAVIPGPNIVVNDIVTGSTIELAALRATDGTQLWSVGSGGGDYALTDAALFGNFTTQEVFARSPVDGHLLWVNSAAGRVLAATAQMLLVDGGHLTALDPQDGHVLWQSPAAFSPDIQAVISVNRGLTSVVIYGFQDHDVVAVRASDGAAVWTTHYGDYFIDGVVTIDGVVFAALTPNKTVTSWCMSECTERIVALDGATGSLYWELDAPELAQFAVPTTS
jgi:outer membrane protein assembly factor BamB